MGSELNANFRRLNIFVPRSQKVKTAQRWHTAIVSWLQALDKILDHFLDKDNVVLRPPVMIKCGH